MINTKYHFIWPTCTYTYDI